MDASADRKSNEINVTMEEPIRILMLFTIMNRGGAETMVMNLSLIHISEPTRP